MTREQALTTYQAAQMRGYYPSLVNHPDDSFSVIVRNKPPRPDPPVRASGEIVMVRLWDTNPPQIIEVEEHTT